MEAVAIMVIAFGFLHPILDKNKVFQKIAKRIFG